MSFDRHIIVILLETKDKGSKRKVTYYKRTMIQISDDLNHKLWGPEGRGTTLEYSKETTQNLEIYIQEKYARMKEKYSLKFKTNLTKIICHQLDHFKEQ